MDKIVSCCKCYNDLPICPHKGSCYAKIRVTEKIAGKQRPIECFRQKAAEIISPIRKRK